MKRIDILGTGYEYSENTSAADPALSSKNGYCDWTSKKIVVDSEITTREAHTDALENTAELKRNTKRHEIIHAFFAESGLMDYCHNEQIVAWIASQFPKMVVAFNEVGAL